jgi:hypothetical protein
MDFKVRLRVARDDPELAKTTNTKQPRPVSPLVSPPRREACPRARWISAWLMTRAEAKAFIAACHPRLNNERCHAEITVDEERWALGFVQGAPFLRSGASHVPAVINLKP